MVQAGTQQLELNVDLGGEVLAQAHVPDATYIYISIGELVTSDYQ